MKDGTVDLRELKAEARRLLPRGHPVRRALEGEPDLLPEGGARAKFGTYLRLLLAAREGGGRRG